jgi:Xaa-Pro aminopeptidase
MQYSARRKQAGQAAEAAGAAALVVTHGPDVRYLTGFTGSSGAVAIAGGRAVLFTDGRYTAQAKAQTTETGVAKGKGVRVAIDKRSPAVRAVEWLAGIGVTKCAFDAGQTTVSALDAMRRALPGKVRRSFAVPTDGLVAKIREIKDETEVAKMRRAAALGCALFEDVLEFIEPGVPEIEVAAKLEFLARMAGAEAMSFDTIAASGARSALPHGQASTAKLPKRGFLTLDFGVVLDGYCSDMTRTVHLGKANQREWDVYHSVLEAQQAAVAAVAPGVACGEVDEAARSVLRKAKLEKAFSHSTGHGVGLEIHEGPRVASDQEQVLQTGMVITIEPGAYLEGEFGVRIEDMVLVTGKSHDVLTAATPKAWMEL